MYGALLTEPATPDADLGVLFLHNEGYSTMCGHGIIALTRVVLELGLFPMERPVTRLEIDTPAGRVRASARIEDRRVAGVCFRNVPSFVVALDDEVEVPGVGRMRYDLGFGGAFYAYVRAEDVGLRCEPEAVGRLVELGGAVKDAVMEARPVEHPTDPDLGFLYGTIFTDPASGADAHSRNVCIFADGEVDRSPTGTGVSGRLAIEHARGRLPVGETFVVESIIGTRFVGRIVEETEVGPYPGVVPEVEGQAYITGRHEFWVDPDDPLGHGFLLR
jgi:trans-L-3-hydroxyproline dehydratase